VHVTTEIGVATNLFSPLLHYYEDRVHKREQCPRSTRLPEKERTVAKPWSGSLLTTDSCEILARGFRATSRSGFSCRRMSWVTPDLLIW